MVQMLLSEEEVRLLRLAKKRRRITCRDANYWTLVEMMRKQALDKVIPKRGNAAGWPYFKVSRQGEKFLKKHRN